jgi:[ribosomal protein S5]-alanine N-acetyltransferase
MDEFKTRRLRAERLRPRHLEELCHLHGDPRAMATLGGVRSDDVTRTYLATNLAHWDRWGHGLWVFRDTAGSFVGRGGLRHLEIGGADEVEVAYALLPDFWGQGLATEMARAMLNLGQSQLGLSRIVALTLTTNHASERVMVKLGMVFERRIEHAGEPCVLYRAPSATTITTAESS